MAGANNTVEERVPGAVQGQGGLARRTFPAELTLLTTPEIVIYPDMAAPLLIEDKTSIDMIEATLKAGQDVVALFGRIAEAEEHHKDIVQETRASDLFPVGTAIQLVRSMRTPDGRLQLLVHGLGRITIQRILATAPYPRVSVKELDDLEETTTRAEAMVRNVIGQFRKAVELAPNVAKEMADTVLALPQQGQQADFIATQLNLSIDERHEILGELNVRRRFEILNAFVNRELEILELRNKIQSEAAGTMEKAQREFFLRQQLKTIQEELGEEGGSVEMDEFREAIEAAGM